MSSCRATNAKALPNEVAATRSLANVRLAASTSFTEEEILALDAMLALLRRGGDASLIARSAPMNNVARKVLSMKGALERQRERRELIRKRCAEPTIPEGPAHAPGEE